MARTLPERSFVALGAIAGIEGACLLAYVAFDAVQAVRIGVTGPAAVSSAPAIILQIAILAAFGVGLLLAGVGWLRVQRWARAPFLLAQLIGLVIGIPLVSGAGGPEKVAGVALVILAVSGIVLVFTPAVTRSLAGDGG